MIMRCRPRLKDECGLFYAGTFCQKLVGEVLLCEPRLVERINVDYSLLRNHKASSLSVGDRKKVSTTDIRFRCTTLDGQSVNVVLLIDGKKIATADHATHRFSMEKKEQFKSRKGENFILHSECNRLFHHRRRKFIYYGHHGMSIALFSQSHCISHFFFFGQFC